MNFARGGVTVINVCIKIARRGNAKGILMPCYLLLMSPKKSDVVSPVKSSDIRNEKSSASRFAFSNFRRGEIPNLSLFLEHR